MAAQEFVQLPEPFVIPGKTHIQQFIIPAELYPGNGFHPLIRTNLDKFHDTRGVVDIGQRQGLNPAAYGLVNEFLHRQGAVAEGVI